jgi:hypothetical protein
MVSFNDVKFGGAEVDFTSAHFSGGVVDLSGALTWSVPPSFDNFAYPPAGLRLPERGRQP